MMLTLLFTPPCFDLFTVRAVEAIDNADIVVMQTTRTAAYNFIRERARQTESLDCYFESAADFESLYSDGAKFITGLARDKNVVFCALGNKSNNGFIQKIESVMPCNSICGGDSVSYAVHEASAKLCAIGGYCAIDCRMLKHSAVDTSLALVITGIENCWVLSDTKLELLEYYSPQQSVLLMCGCETKALRLEEIDRTRGFGDGLVLVLPPVELIKKERFGFYDLAEIMRILRGENGCPWDAQQSHKTLRPYLIEEAYEVMDAIDSGDMNAVYDELGDVLLQVMFHADIARSLQEFGLNDITTSICKKLIQRHPHVFANAVAETPEEVVTNWESIKRGEKGIATVTDALKDVSKTMGALMRAAKIQKKAAAVGFDWEDEHGAYKKVIEEAAEFMETPQTGLNNQAEDEGGDLLFAAVNLLRKRNINPETALSRACEKFIRRFGYIEDKSAGRLRDLTLNEMDILWEEAKKRE